MITDLEIERLADAIFRYQRWQQREAERKERQKFECRIRRQRKAEPTEALPGTEAA